MSKHNKPTKHSQNVMRAMQSAETPASTTLAEPLKETTAKNVHVLQCTAQGTAHDCCASWDGWCHRSPGLVHACCAPRGAQPTVSSDDDAQAIIDALPSAEEVQAAAGDPAKAAAMLDRIGAAIGLPPDEIASVVARFSVPHLGDTVVIPGHHMGMREQGLVVAIVVHVDEKTGLFEALAFGPSGYDVMRRVVVDAMKPGTWRHA